MEEYKYPSFEELRRMIKKVGKEKMEKIFSNLSGKKFSGPTIDQYFAAFESQYQDVFYGDDICIDNCETVSFKRYLGGGGNIKTPKQMDPEFSSGYFFS